MFLTDFIFCYAIKDVETWPKRFLQPVFLQPVFLQPLFLQPVFLQPVSNQ